MKTKRTNANEYTQLSRKLRSLGFYSLDAYRKSAFFSTVKLWFAESKRLQACLKCESPDFHLHFWNYNAVGNETPNDLLPLCDTCFVDYSRFLDKHNLHPTNDIRRILTQFFGLSQRFVNSLRL